MKETLKIFVTAILIVMISSKSTTAQHIEFAPLYEKTIAGNQLGGSLQFQSNKGWLLGAFYQNRVEFTKEGIIANDSFIGASIAAPLVKNEQLSFLINLRAGLINENFVALVPGLETQWMFGKHFGVSAGTSVRSGYPSALFKVLFKPF